MPDCYYGLVVPANVVDGEVVPQTKKFSECISRATKKIRKARQSVVIDGLLLCTRIATNNNIMNLAKAIEILNYKIKTLKTLM